MAPRDGAPLLGSHSHSIMSPRPRALSSHPKLAKIFNRSRFRFLVLFVLIAAIATQRHYQQALSKETQSVRVGQEARQIVPSTAKRENDDDDNDKDRGMEQSFERIDETSKTMPSIIGNATKPQNDDDRPLPCTLLSKPAPMILMSLGRSGTASMYQVLSKLSGTNSGDSAPRIIEYTGSNTPASREFFREHIPANDVNGDWLMKFICHEQRHHPDAGMVGFKWKPFETLFTEEKAKQGLELLARLGKSKHYDGPQIKVIRSRRNLLDVRISRHKHDSSRAGFKGEISAHCQKDDEHCLKQQLKAGTGLSLPTRRLISQLQELDDQENELDNLLENMNVPTISASFERLFLAGNDTSEWTRIFRYMGVGPTVNLTADDVERAGHAATSIPLHNVTLSNYEEVRTTLLGTKFASLLH